MANKVKFKPGDKVIISKDSKNIWIQGKKSTIIRFLEEENVPGSFYQWTYEVRIEDDEKPFNAYVPQWEMKLEEDTKHHCIFKISHPDKHSENYFCKFVQDFKEDQEGAEMMRELMNNFRKPGEDVIFVHRLLEQEEFDEIQEYLKQFPHANLANIYSPVLNSVTIQSSIK